jgi:GNAT superfamily N-acetyltransferase
MTVEIRLAPSGSGAVCSAILAELPQWFGMAESNAEYARLAESGPAWLATRDVGIMLLKPHFADTLEIALLAVRPTTHRRGVGRALVEQAEALARSQSARFLSVKTLGPSDAYEPYARTRAFYRAIGFAALEEFTEIWGPENPTLLMAKAVL